MSDLRSLCRWGVIGVEGADAVAFLQAQLSNDIAGMGDGQLRLAGLCTAKGRLLGSFFVARQGEAVMLICRADTIAALVKRLSMFVLRSKCKVMDWTDRCELSYLTDCGQTHPMTVQWSAPLTGVISLRAFDGALPGLQIQPKTDAVCDSSCDDAFELALFNLGIAYIGSAAVELFVPQAINFDLVGGVSFSKGCYPGQEVVARSHYLGKLKRRAFKAMASGAGLKVGADVWLAGKDNEPVGQVVTVVTNDQAICAMLELPIEDVETPGARFFVKTEEGELVLQLIQPPYDVHQKGSQFASA